MFNSKSEYRKYARHILAQIAPQYWVRAGILLREKIIRFLASQKEKKVALLGYSALPNEIPISVLDLSEGNHFEFFLPRISSNEQLEFFSITSKDPLHYNKYQILEPEADVRRKWYSEKYDLSLILVPGLLFNQNCFRLGHGQGYYDRFFYYLAQKSTKQSAILKIGILWDAQLANHLPVDVWDIPLNDLWIFT